MTTLLDLLAERPTTLLTRFEAFETANPHVFVALERLAQQAIDAGHTRLAISQLFEVLRWEMMIATRGDEYRLNNSWRSFYSRRLMEAHDEWPHGLFTTRTLRG